MKKFRKWVALGRLAAIVLSQQNAGSALARETELAERFGLSRTTLRHYRDAVMNVRAAFEVRSRNMLFTQSAVAANTVARWYQRDPVGVERFLAEQWPRSDAEIIAAAREAKRSNSKIHRQVSLAELLSRAMRNGPPIFDQMLASNIGLEPGADQLQIRPAQGETARFLGIDVELVDPLLPPPSKHGTRIGFFEIGPRVTFERYRQEARDIWTRAVAASLHYDLIVMTFPGPAARRRFLAALPDAAVIEWICSGEERSDRCASVPILCRPGRGTGAVLVSTRLGLAIDLFGWQHRGRDYWRTFSTTP